MNNYNRNHLIIQCKVSLLSMIGERNVHLPCLMVGVRLTSTLRFNSLVLSVGQNKFSMTHVLTLKLPWRMRLKKNNSNDNDT